MIDLLMKTSNNTLNSGGWTEKMIEWKLNYQIQKNQHQE